MTVHLYKCVVSYNTFDVINLHIFTHAHEASFTRKQAFVKLASSLVLKNKPIQTRIIPFPESKFNIMVMLGWTFFLILLALAVNI